MAPLACWLAPWPACTTPHAGGCPQWSLHTPGSAACTPQPRCHATPTFGSHRLQAGEQSMCSRLPQTCRRLLTRGQPSVYTVISLPGCCRRMAEVASTASAPPRLWPAMCASVEACELSDSEQVAVGWTRWPAPQALQICYGSIIDVTTLDDTHPPRLSAHLSPRSACGRPLAHPAQPGGRGPSR